MKANQNQREADWSMQKWGVWLCC